VELPPRNPWQQRLVAVSQYATLFVGTRFPQSVPLVFVVGFPKSGTTWAAQLVADYLQLPFPQQYLFPVGFQAVVHGHFRVRPTMQRLIYMVRDGRDTMASLYFHLQNDYPRMPLRWRRMVGRLRNNGDIRKNMPAFIEWQMKRPFGCHLNWADHVRAFLDMRQRRRIPLLKYEQMLHDAEGTLSEAMTDLLGCPSSPERIRATVERFSFGRQSGRKAGEENRSSFLRKGQAGDWVNHFTREAAELFDHHCGEALVALGYVKDRSWVEQCRPGPE
jgi:hypothetical protein